MKENGENNDKKKTIGKMTKGSQNTSKIEWHEYKSPEYRIYLTSNISIENKKRYTMTILLPHSTMKRKKPIAPIFILFF